MTRRRRLPTSREHAPHDGDGIDQLFAYRDVAALHAASSVGNHDRFAIVVARFNSAITDALFAGAVHVLREAGCAAGNINAISVPGAIEIPVVAGRLAASGQYRAIVALGCVIRGDTAHFDYVCRAVTDGCMRVALDTATPVGFGVVTCDTMEQALARASRVPGEHNVGADAAAAAVETANALTHAR